MKTIILAGGLGTRITEETVNKPKPMINIGNYPLIWHIMKIYSFYNFNNFIIALGYKGEIIKKYFKDYYYLNNNSTLNLRDNEIKLHSDIAENWILHFLDTGIKTQTGGRIKNAFDFIGNERVFATYGDALADINISKLLDFHKSHGKLATVSIVRPPSRFGKISLQDNKVVKFEEKPQLGEGWINGGFFVLEPEVKDYIKSFDQQFETFPMEQLAKDGQLMAFKHEGFWHPCDVIRDKINLENYWNEKKAPWKLWN